MAKIGDRLKELRRVVQLHVNWFTVVLLGEDALTDEELQELEKYARLPPAKSLDFGEKSFLLGRLQATMKSSEYKKLSYEELEEEASKASFTSLEEYSREYAKLHASDGLKSLTDSLAAGAFDRLKGAVQEAVSEASVRGIVRDKEAMRLTEKQPYQRAVSALASTLKSAIQRDWKLFAATELHRAKQQGTAQAIVNKVGPYRHSDGPDSFVRVVPNPDTCIDCGDRYVGEDGQPKVFRLTELMQAGSNADEGVKHTRVSGKHGHWKTTLPPLHPGCGCRIVYVPGHGALSKAVDAGSMSATITPPGPPQAPSQPKPASVPGMPAPGNTPGPGAPSSSSVDPLGKTDIGSSTQMVKCPFGGGDECRKHGGHGGKTHEAGGSEMKAHQEHLDNGAVPTDPEAAEAMKQREREAAAAYTKHPPKDAQVLKDIGTGKIAEIRNTRDGMSPEEQAAAKDKGIVGIADSFKARIEGNGNAMMKPGTVYVPGTNEIAVGDLGQCPAGQFHKHEAAAYDYASMLGISDGIPPTTTRVHEGQEMSSQAWCDGFSPMGTTLAGTEATQKAKGNAYKGLLNNCPEDKRGALKKKVDELITATVASNGGDDHTDNWMVNEDFSDVRKIDNGASFGNSMFGCKNSMLLAAAKASPDGVFKMPDHLVERMKTTSLDDMKKALPHLQDWQVGQQFLRQQYMLHLQEQDGGLDPEKFLPTWGDANSDHGAQLTGAYRGSWGGTLTEAADKFDERAKAGQLPHQMFDSFCKAWIQDQGRESPHYHAAQELDYLGVFMPPDSMKDPSGARRSGAHKSYAATISAAYPPKKEEMLLGKQAQALKDYRESLNLKNRENSEVWGDRQRAAAGEDKTDPASAVSAEPKPASPERTAPSTPLSKEDRTRPTKSQRDVSKGLRLYLDLTRDWS